MSENNNVVRENLPSGPQNTGSNSNATNTLKRSTVPGTQADSLTTSLDHQPSSSPTFNRSASLGNIPDDLSEQGSEVVNLSGSWEGQREEPGSSPGLKTLIDQRAAEESPGETGLKNNNTPSQCTQFAVSTDGLENSESESPQLRAQKPGFIPDVDDNMGTDSSARHDEEPMKVLGYEYTFAGGMSAAATGIKSHGVFIKQETFPMTDEEIENDVRAIYHGLYTVEEKCKEINMHQVKSKRSLSDYQWQAVVLLHKTLLQEHHDLLMALKLASENPNLNRLSETQTIPLRMCRNGIIALVESLRLGLPNTLDHLRSFIHLAYEFLTSMLECVPAFNGYWLECLGALSKHRMDVETENPQERAFWAGIAKYWYNKAADLNPDIGRIQHHLGTVSQPNPIQQLFYYTRSLVSVHSFLRREDALVLFKPFVRGPGSMHHDQTITAFVTAHGHLFVGDAPDRFISSADDFIFGLDEYTDKLSGTFKIQGAYMASSNIAAMLGYGMGNAPSLIEFTQKKVPKSGTSEESSQSAPQRWESISDPQEIATQFLALRDSQGTSRLTFYGSCFTFQSLSVLLDRLDDENILPSLHVSLAFLWCLASTPTGMKYAELVMPWTKLENVLNGMVDTCCDMELVESDDFPFSDDAKWLFEDFLIRGQTWSRDYYPQSFFKDAPDEGDGRNIELPSLDISRMYRCLWLGIRLAKFNRWMKYDVARQEFSVTPFAQELEKLAELYSPFSALEYEDDTDDEVETSS